jgi:lipopolysaccharide/colanic/teichoic acid biosynthesis glycosyltransferase
MGVYVKVIKRALDILFAALFLAILSPLFLILAIVSRARLGSPIFFAQERPGKDEKIFRLYKFRTMTDAKGKDGEFLPDGERLTPYGKFLRRTSLDELPELVNILKGEMSFIGPRPLLVRYLPRYNAEQKRRHLVRPGLTGLAQVSGRNAISWPEKFACDVQYVDNVSFGMDAKIFFRTITMVIKREGISSEGEATMPEFLGDDKMET